MKIEAIDIIHVEMAKEDPEWGFALTAPTGGEAKSKGFIIELTTDEGVIGLGYTSASAHHGSTYAGVQAALKTYTDLLIGKDPFDMEKIFMEMDRLLWGNNRAKAAIDLALHDLQAKALGIPLYSLLGGLVREEIPIIRILALKEPEQMAANALKLVEQGYAYIKVKLNGDPVKDLSRMREIRKAVGDDIHLTVDANQSYTPKVAIDTLKRMQEFGVALCEQPVRKDDWEGLAAVTRAVDCIVEAHESALSLENIFGLVKCRAVDCINIKITQVGGFRVAKVAAAICKLGNVSVRVGTTGSRLVSAASMHFVAATENISYACELGEFSRLLDDPIDGLEVEDGILRVPSSPGVGVQMRS
ncbi:mandelate racemase/muconate lactonizing enzyme family protein [Thermodesulfobacteriota bacterium]